MKFKPEDFKIEWETPDGVRFDAESKTGIRIAEALADKANARLAEMLAEAPKVFVTKNPATGWAAMEASPLVDNFPFTGRLVDIREIEK